MKFNKKVMALLLVLAIALSIVVPISLSTNADTVPAVGVKFNLRAVNLLSGEITLTDTSTLTIQYTDATLGDNMKMYATIEKSDGTTVLDSAEVPEANLKILTQTVYGANEEIPGEDKDCETANNGKKTLTMKNIHSNAAGAVSFVPGSTVNGLTVSELTITVWTQDTATGVSSSKATTTINNGFTNDTPTGLTSSNWMNYIDGSTLLSQINIPGSHDSGAYKFDAVSEVLNKCQESTITDQLNDGVRYLDIRASGLKSAYSGNTNTQKRTDIPELIDFRICHADFYAQKTDGSAFTFYDLYLELKRFLKEHPSETIILALSDDGDIDNYANEARENIMKAVASFVKYDPTLFYTKGTEIPTLDDVRGKVVLFRRMVNGHVRTDHAGMDFFWIDGKFENTTNPHAIVPRSESNGSEWNANTLAVTTYYVQDNYRSDAGDKWTYATDFLGNCEAGNKKVNQYWLNFLSAAGETSASPKSIADNVNPKFKTRGLTKGTQYGYILFDFVAEEFCQIVYNTNIFLSEPQLKIDTSGHIVSDRNDKKVVHYDFAKVENNTVPNTENNGFDGTLVNTSLVSHSSIYDLITLNNSGKNYTDAGYVNIQQGVLAGGNETATIQVWLKASEAAHATTLFGTGSYNVFVAITRFDDQTARFVCGPQKTVYEGRGGGNPVSSTESWDLNKWYLFTYVLEGGKIKIYKNDTLMAEGPVDANFSDIGGGVMYNDPFCLGTAPMSDWKDPGFTGSIGDFTIYNYAVDKSEIETTYNTLAKDYTYILEATLEDGETAVARENIAGTCIEENYYNSRSKIYFTVPSDYDVTNAKLSLKYDGSSVLISENGGAYKTFDPNTAYDLSDAILKVISLNEEDYSKEYEIVVNGVIVKDFVTHEFIEVQGTNTTVSLPEIENSLFWWYNSTKDAEISTASAGDVVYLKQIAIDAPIIEPDASKSIRAAEDKTNGLRFKATITREDFYNYFNNADADYVYEEGSEFTFGILLMPEDVLAKRGLVATDLTREKVSDAVDVVGKKIFEQGLIDNGLDYTAVILNIPEAQYTRNFVARAYIEYTYGNDTEIIYSNKVSIGSYLSVAQAAYADAKAKNDTDTMDKLLEIFTEAELTE